MGMYRITIAGIYEYNNHLFDNMLFPEGADKQVFIDSLMLSYGDCEPIYPDAEFMQQNAIPAWSKKWQDSIDRVFTALKKSYNAIENYDRYEEWTDKPDIERNIITGGRDTNTTQMSSDGSASNGGSDKMEQKVSAFDSASYQPKQEDTTTYGANTSTKATEHGISNVDYGRSETSSEKGITTHTGHIHGNIGVTTNQQMLESELHLRKQSFIDYCTRLFANDLLILVY